MNESPESAGVSPTATNETPSEIAPGRSDHLHFPNRPGEGVSATALSRNDASDIQRYIAEIKSTAETFDDGALDRGEVKLLWRALQELGDSFKEIGRAHV